MTASLLANLLINASTCPRFARPSVSHCYRIRRRKCHSQIANRLIPNSTDAGLSANRLRVDASVWVLFKGDKCETARHRLSSVSLLAASSSGALSDPAIGSDLMACALPQRTSRTVSNRADWGLVLCLGGDYLGSGWQAIAGQ